MMSVTLFGKAVLVWFVIALLAIANGALRDLVLAPAIGAGVARPLSGISLSAIVLLVSYLVSAFLGTWKSRIYWFIGVQWVLMTLAFEFLFGHFVAGRSWAELLQTFNILQGDLFLLVLLVTLCAPRLAAGFRGIV